MLERYLRIDKSNQIRESMSKLEKDIISDTVSANHVP